MVGLPLVGVGGITTLEDALEFIMAGASCLQVGTATFAQPLTMTTLIDQLAAWMEREGVRSIGELKVQEALADLTELAAGLHGSIGQSDGTLERVQERVEDKRNFAKGRVRVARDAFDTGDVVAWRLPGGLYHIGIVAADVVPNTTRRYVIHNIGRGAQKG